MLYYRLMTLLSSLDMSGLCFRRLMPRSSAFSRATFSWERIIRDEPHVELDPDDSELPTGMAEDQDLNDPFPQTPR